MPVVEYYYCLMSYICFVFKSFDLILSFKPFFPSFCFFPAAANILMYLATVKFSF